MTLKPFDERVAWTKRNMPWIRKIAENPWSGLELYPSGAGLKVGRLNDAADPIQFVAHCIDLVQAIDAGKNYITRLPLWFDATNSGAQHYSLLARDRDGARLTNLIYENGVEDLYKDVSKRIKNSLTVQFDEFEKHVRAEAEAARESGNNNLAEVETALRSRPTKDRRFAQWWISKDVLKRKFIKLLCIEALYGATDRGLAKELRKDLMKETIPEIVIEKVVPELAQEEEKVRLEVRHRRTKKEELDEEKIEWMVERIRSAIDEALPGAKKIMDYVRILAELQGKRGEVLSWYSPSGVLVVNECREEAEETMSLWLDFVRVRHNVVVDGPGLDRAHCTRSAPPNLVHSLDAAAMALTANECARARIPMGAVHDCFGWLAPDVDEGRRIYKQELVGMYEKCDVLEQLRNQVPGAPPLPDRGDLDLKEVLKAQYLIN